NNAVWALQIKEDGAGFALEDLPPLIKSTSRSFRPVDAKFGPDGALYIADWSNPIIGHYQASFRHPDRDKTRGRIWRVTAKDRALTKPPELFGAAIPQLLDQLKSPDRWTRHFAKRGLAERATGPVVKELKAWTASANPSEHALMEALGVYQSHEAIAPDLLARLCRATEPGARAYAASVVGAWADKLPNALALLRPLAADAHPRVRLQAIVACTYLTNANAIEVVAGTVDFPTDKFLDYAFKQAVFALKPYWLGALRRGELTFGAQPARLAAVVKADGTPDTLQAIVALLDGEKVKFGAGRQELLLTLAEVGGPAELARLLERQTFLTPRGYDASQHAQVLRVLEHFARARTVRPAHDPAAALAALTDENSPDRALHLAVLRLATAWKVKPDPSLVSAAIGGLATADDELRIAAATALAVLNPSAASNHLQDLTLPTRAVGQRVAGAIGFAALDLRRGAGITAEILQCENCAGTVTNLLPTFVGRRGGAQMLAAAMTDHAPSIDSARLALGWMNAAGRSDKELIAVLMRASAQPTQNSRMTAGELTAFVEEVRRRGDARAGAEVFQRPQLGCVACHAVNGQGGSIGPNLSALGSAQPVDFIVGAILEPQKEIKEGFTAISVTTKDGEEYQGYQLRETKDELVLRDTLQNQEVRLRRAAIQEKRVSGSVMPAGLVDTLRREEFRDLVRYLSELGRTN
ncbi:MAG TPA: c-type cytochrome, partial [Opitutaceae bacterium]|nr:c-type cytochrome [Opitutaceae bacterium]